VTITVRFFASIREKAGRGEASIESRGVATAADVWASTAGFGAPPNLLVAINQEYARLDQPVKDGDEVAFFPPVTGG
jgi:molybdopterin synthase sulfur carrier subunit